MNLKKLVFGALFSVVFFTSCSDDDDTIVETPIGAYDNGVLILNQGGFGKGNASLSYLSVDSNTFQNNIFALVNPTIILGDTGQDVGFYNEFAYIVMNGSNKIEIVNRYTMAHVATISTGLSNPRYIVFYNGKGYVSNWGNGSSTSDDYIAVINLSNNTLSAPIPVMEGPEQMAIANGKLYVAHLGGLGVGSTVSIINLSTNGISSLSVGDAPNSLEISGETLYVLSGGKPSWTGSETAGKLSKINLSNDTVSGTIDFALTSHPSNLEISNSDLFYTVDSDVFKTLVNTSTLPTTALFSTTAQGVYGVYSFEVQNEKIYIGDAVDYSSDGKIYVYSSTGNLEISKTVGVVPAGFYFN
ncbi:YncE family protein [Flavobacterium luteum]|uniref:YncE family protein n=1 Tax=Flavobacterium luteum TaxID=2026654 RepID=A0A7J5AFR8_9FLAO|nr:DUF5074 domain-containing protein [Flavobacterium luteum]KAB1156288.1 hypothetical protein F6464_08845 [Flavobacterium luteum]